MHYIIFDLEATCWTESHDLLQQEIIEIGAFVVNRYGENVSKFNCFVKPEIHPFLSPFCQELTTITQDQVSSAKGFKTAYKDFIEWVNENVPAEFLFCSWGSMDIDLFSDDCLRHQCDFYWEENYLDLKQKYNRFKGYHKPIGFKAALRKEDLEFHGTQHRAIDDAYNLAHLFVKYIDVWES